MTQKETNAAAGAFFVRAMAAFFLLLGLSVPFLSSASGETRDAGLLALAPVTVFGAASVPDSLFGHSGKLLLRTVTPGKKGMSIGILATLFGDSALSRPSVHTIELPDMRKTFSLATLVPFSEKIAGKVGSYRIGTWPSETRAGLGAAYQPPPGFIRVTRENQDTHVSENFRLRDFLTKDQAAVWPKYLVLRTELVDKLELIIADLRSRGHEVKKMSVMSGFRTPQYNALGVGSGGRANLSRHQYGDAADVFVDNKGTGNMSDLNRDGRVDTRDSQVILDAAARVERRYPDLLGGSGLYDATSAHGPFAHVDVRGVRAIWKG
jgi:uncharacterized protein YcbK (DUF882 family)